MDDRASGLHYQCAPLSWPAAALASNRQRNNLSTIID